MPGSSTRRLVAWGSRSATPASTADDAGWPHTEATGSKVVKSASVRDNAVEHPRDKKKPARAEHKVGV